MLGDFGRKSIKRAPLDQQRYLCLPLRCMLASLGTYTVALSLLGGSVRLAGNSPHRLQEGLSYSFLLFLLSPTNVLHANTASFFLACFSVLQCWCAPPMEIDCWHLNFPD